MGLIAVESGAAILESGSREAARHYHLPMSTYREDQEMTFSSFKPWMALALGAAMLGLAGCAGYSPAALPAGTALSEVVQVMGPPTGQYARPANAAAGTAKRLEYAKGPFGQHTFMLDFDAGDRLMAWQQVLTEERFNVIRPGMPKASVLELIGRPSRSRSLSFQRQQVWSYRYETPFCQWFQVGIGEQGTVVDTIYSPDPLCENAGDEYDWIPR
jgi:hypothetical protein